MGFNVYGGSWLLWLPVIPIVPGIPQLAGVLYNVITLRMMSGSHITTTVQKNWSRLHSGFISDFKDENGCALH